MRPGIVSSRSGCIENGLRVAFRDRSRPVELPQDDPLHHRYQRAMTRGIEMAAWVESQPKIVLIEQLVLQGISGDVLRAREVEEAHVPVGRIGSCLGEGFAEGRRGCRNDNPQKFT